jgi:hypothetical protein
MGEGIKEVVAAIDALPTVDSADDLSRLQNLADRYFIGPEAANYLGVWFRLYERFPEDDGCGVFWSVLHRIEAQPGYEQPVVESVRRRPSRFPVLMANRLLNSGIRQVGGVDLLELLRRVAADEQCPPSVREDAQGFLEYQRSWA